MLFASVASLVLLFAAGALLVVAAFRSEAIAGWENRVLISMAGGVAKLRMALEEKQALAEARAAAEIPAAAVAADTDTLDFAVLRAAREEQERQGRMTA